MDTTLYRKRCSMLLEEIKDYKRLNDYSNFRDIYSLYEFQTIIKGKQCRKQKRYRTDLLIKDMLRIKSQLKVKSHIVFGTCTLSDKELNHEERTRMKKLGNYLKEHYLYVVVNKDFGSKTEREHYHFIGLTIEEIEPIGKKSNKGFEMYELVNKNYKLGFEPNIIPVETDSFDKTRNYLLKLNNHATKDTTKNRIRVYKNTTGNLLNKMTKKIKTKSY